MAEQRIRVLLIEDDEDDYVVARDLIAEVKSASCDLEWKRTYDEGLAAILEQRHDLILLDYMLGERDGLGIVREAHARRVHTPIVLLTGVDDQDVEDFAARTGVADYLVKGQITPRLLGRAIRYALAEQRTRARLSLAERLTSLGTLAAGMSHEINNPLACVLSNTAFAIEEIDLAMKGGDAGAEGTARLAEARAALTESLEAAERVRLVVRDMNTFARADEEKQGPLDVRKLLDSVLSLAQNQIRHRAQVVREYGEVPLVDANEARLAQALLKLIVNAAQAIREGNAEKNTIRMTTRTDDAGRAVIAIADTGSGMTPEVLARIFDPFFTTKDIGQGTGLGLSVCHGIVATLGGKIDVETTLGKGSCFTVILPPSWTTAPRERPPSAPPVTGSKRGRLLVVDDEPMVGRAIRRMLGKEHDVVLAGRGADAIDQIVRGGERFDVILCDLMMPDVTGMDLYEALHRDVPDEADRIIFLTGGAFTPAARAFLDKLPGRWLEKPFDPNKLRAALRARIGA
jgi:signal transduction histidine kinase